MRLPVPRRRDDIADCAQWERREQGLAAEVAALQAQLEAKLAEQAQCAAHVARCDGAINVVRAKFAKSAKRLQSKRDAFVQVRRRLTLLAPQLFPHRVRPTAPRNTCRAALAAAHRVSLSHPRPRATRPRDAPRV